MRLGFGFVEAGTVTPRPQPGNPRPRLFRLPHNRAVINRMGFNNAGIDAYVAHLASLSDRPCPFGANVGINKEGADPERDYPALVAAVAPFADYVTINVSSPNTPGLRDLQGEARLRAILQAVAAQVPVRPPVLVKIAPDLSECRTGSGRRDRRYHRGGGADRRQHHHRSSSRACRSQRAAGRRPLGRAAVRPAPPKCSPAPTASPLDA